MKNIPIIFIFLFLSIISINCIAQIPQPKSVTIDPGVNNIQDIKGNLKVTGFTESNSVRVNGLSTGNPYIARPVYANNDGFLVTGYVTGYFSIHPSAFKLSYNINSDGASTAYGSDFTYYADHYVIFLEPSTNRELYTPLFFPHKSKLSGIKFLFSNSNTNSVSITGEIIRAPVDNFNGATSIFTFNTPVSSNSSIVSINIPIDLLEIDNENFSYSLKLSSSTQSWKLIIIGGANIEYRDF
ncbi:hypothetical protein [Emticicia fontis]